MQSKKSNPFSKQFVEGNQTSCTLNFENAHYLTLAWLETKVGSLCHQYRASPASAFVLYIVG